MESHVRDSELRYRTLTEAVPQMIFTASHTGNIHYWNSRWYAYTGTSPERTGGIDWLHAMHPDDQPLVEARWRDCLSRGENPNIECRIRSRDGTYRWFLLHALASRQDDRDPYRWVGSLSDIDEQKRTNDDLRQANRDLEQFAYVSSHDLQEPLRMISNYLELIELRHRKQLEPQAVGYLRHAVEAANRMRALINDLLVYARIGRAEPMLPDVNTQGVLADVLSQGDARIQLAHAQLVVGSLPATSGSQSELAIVFQHLISNALTYQAQGRPPRIEIQGSARNDVCQFTIMDNGIGIDLANHDRIFEVFQRLHNRSEYAGSGIGLAICKRIVERHHGRIWVRSTLGNGATFFFTWPAARGPSL